MLGVQLRAAPRPRRGWPGRSGQGAASPQPDGEAATPSPKSPRRPCSTHIGLAVTRARLNLVVRFASYLLQRQPATAHPFRRSDYGSYALPTTRRMFVNVMDSSLRAGAKKRVVAVIVCEDTTSNRVPAVTFDGCPGGVTLNHGHCLCSPFLTDTATLGSWV